MRHTELGRRSKLVATGVTGAVVAMSGVVALWDVAAHAAGATLYVDKTVAACSDTGSGSSAAPLCTIAQAMKRLTAGTTVYIGDGTYPETITPPVSGTSSAPIIITGWPGRHPVVGTGAAYGAKLYGLSWVTVSELTVSGTVYDGIYVYEGDHDTISGNEVSLAGQPVSGKTAPGVRLSSTTAATVTGNNTHDNSDTGIYLTNGTTGTLVAQNVSSNNARQYQRNANGINVTAPGNTILENITHDNEDSGIQFYPGGNDNVAVGNVTYNNGDHGIDDWDVTGGRITGNTVFRNCTTGINIEGTSGNYVVENNIAVDNAVYPAYQGIACSRRAGNIGVWDSAPPTTTVDHNLVWLSTSGKLYVFGSSYTSLSAMQAATGQESHGVQANPWFVDPSAWNLQLQEGSAAIDRGDSGAAGEQATDLLGNPRVDDPSVPNTYAQGPRLYDDLGAYEFQPAPTTPTPTPTPTSTTPTPTPTPTSTTPTPTPTTTTTTPTPTPTTTTPVPSPTTSPPMYVGTIANNYSTSVHTSAYITVYKSTGVQAGDYVVLCLQLSGTPATGTVSGTDAAGNTYQAGASVTDAAGDRLVVLTGVAQHGLVSGDKITVSFPSAATYRLSGDEYAGLSHTDHASVASGTTSTFSSGSAQTSANGEAAFGVVATFGGTANPSWSTGWTSIGTYSVSGRYLAKADVLPASGSYTATGTATGTWLAAVVTLAP